MSSQRATGHQILYQQQQPYWYCIWHIVGSNHWHSDPQTGASLLEQFVAAVCPSNLCACVSSSPSNQGSIDQTLSHALSRSRSCPFDTRSLVVIAAISIRLFKDNCRTQGRNRTARTQLSHIEELPVLTRAPPEPKVSSSLRLSGLERYPRILGGHHTPRSTYLHHISTTVVLSAPFANLFASTSVEHRIHGTRSVVVARFVHSDSRGPRPRRCVGFNSK